ncbi:MAG TPA: dihydrofolate reductase family protein, partial [Terrimesophilobacter sp.]|nr:dihydrofolate reductase family protein [Terrimesophilobacter sp.]
DRRILGSIRRNSSVVLVGAATVRAEGHLFPRSTNLAVATQSGDLTGHVFSPDLAPGRLIVVCPASAVPAVHSTLGDVPATILDIEATTVSPHDLIGALRGHGCDTIVCEGGPSLAAQLIDANLVDELCLTTSPLIAGSRSSALHALPVSHRHELELGQLLTDSTGSVYARWMFSERSH